MDKKIIGFCGKISSGKGTACAYLQEKYGAEIVMFSQSLRDVLNRLYMDITRENMQKLSTILRQEFSQSILAKVVSQDAQNSQANLIVVDGIRRPKDIEYLEKLPNFILVSIEAEQEKRWQRLVTRGQNQDDINKTFEQFKIDEQAETELLIDEIAKKANYVIDNNGSTEDFFSQIEIIYSK